MILIKNKIQKNKKVGKHRAAADKSRQLFFIGMNVAVCYEWIDHNKFY